jgi:hypothetical protein
MTVTNMAYDTYITLALQKYNYNDILMYLNFELNSSDNYLHSIHQFEKNDVVILLSRLLNNKNLLFSN